MMNDKIISLIIFFLLPTYLFAQDDAALKYAAGITGNDLRKHLTIIASAEMEGRETASPGQKKAAAYIEDQFKSIGLKHPSQINDYQQSYPLYKDTLLSSLLKIGKTRYEFGKDFIINAGRNLKEEIKSKEIIFAGYGIADKKYDDYAGKNVTGKTVIFFSGEPKINGKSISAGVSRNSIWSTNRKMILAKQKGAVGALIILGDAIPKTTVDNIKKTTLNYPRPVTKENDRIANATITTKVAADILGITSFPNLSAKAKIGEALNTINLKAEVKLKLEYKKRRIHFSSTNVIGYVEGTDKKDEYVFLTGHYDHLGKRDGIIYYGADDDGSGTVSVIEMAQAFAKAKAEGNGPRRTIVFMIVSGEEKGLWGS